MSYHGDIALGDTIDIQFTTVQSSGAPITLAGTPAISAYIGNSTTQITAGITLTVDLDTVTGLHNVRVVATSGNGYTAQSNVSLVITTGTINGVSAVGYQIGSFSIENRSAVRPTVAGRTLDIATTGEAGLDLSNVNGTLDLAEIGADTLRALGVLHVGTFSAGSTTSGTLNSGGTPAAINDDDRYNGNTVLVYSSAGAFKGAATIDDQAGLVLTWVTAIDTAVANTDIAVIVATPAGATTSSIATATRAEMDANSTQFAKLGTPVSTVSADIATVKAFVDTEITDIQSRLPAALTGGGNMKADIIAVSSDTNAADNIEAAFDGTGGVTFYASMTAAERTAAAVSLLGTGIDATGVSSRTVRSALAPNRNKISLDPTTGALTVYDTDDTTVLWTGTGTFAASARNAIQTIDPA